MFSIDVGSTSDYDAGTEALNREHNRPLEEPDPEQFTDSRFSGKI